MKKLFILSLCLVGTFISNHIWAGTVQEGQSTEGKDFWMTFLKADQNNSSDNITLSLSIASRKNCTVTIENPFSKYRKTIDVIGGTLNEVKIYEGTPDAASARSTQAMDSSVCYAVNSEKIDTCALHITSTDTIALFATNYKKATFDATNIIPTKSLLDEYVIQTYSPSDHEKKPQGSHFAIIATEDNTIVDYCPTVYTDSLKELGDTLSTPVLNKGQVYYVLSKSLDWTDADLSGTWVKARNNKSIAVFQGCPHTNIPYMVHQRDHIYSQAMPTQYWGNTFVLTASKNRTRDKYRILALSDETEIRINGKLVHTFHFDSVGSQYQGDDYNPWSDKKHFFEFEIGQKGVKCGDKKATKYYNEKSSDPNIKEGKLPNPLVEGDSCIVTTSCPCAVHLFIVSQQWGGDGKTNGDPAMLWVNPIEQQINQVTFSTYASKNGDNDTYHYTNIVTENPQGMYLDNVSIQNEFKPIGTSGYYFLQKTLETTPAKGEAKIHTLNNTEGSFIAHVYGFTKNESYGYSAGGATIPLTDSITINGKTYKPGVKNPPLCPDDSAVTFVCKPSYTPEKIIWNFGDGSPLEYGDSVVHTYPSSFKTDSASCTIVRSSSSVCAGQTLKSVIRFSINIGSVKIGVKGDSIPRCSTQGSNIKYYIFLDNPSKTELTGDSVKIEFDQTAKDDGFDASKLTISKDTLIIDVPKNAKENKKYGINVHIGAECKASVTDISFTFEIEYYKNYMDQRFRNALETVIGIDSAEFKKQKFIQQLLQEKDNSWYISDFVWTANNVVIPNQNNSVLHLNYESDTIAEYMVCFTLHRPNGTDSTICSCPIKIKANINDSLIFMKDSTANEAVVQATWAREGSQVFVNALDQGSATWYDTQGNVLSQAALPKGGGLIMAPQRAGLYILKVDAGHQRTFKFLVTK